MGIPTDPDEYGDDCPVCFAAGETPKDMYFFVSGIQKGALWNIGFGEPFMGGFKLPQVAPCTWHAIDGIIEAGYSTDNPGSFFEVIGLLGASHFVGTAVNDCVYWFANQFVAPPGVPFYGGQAQVFFIPPGPSPSIADVMELINMERDPATMCEGFPAVDGSMNVLLANLQKSDNILIKYENNV